jgi:hypothetical protein
VEGTCAACLLSSAIGCHWHPAAEADGASLQACFRGVQLWTASFSELKQQLMGASRVLSRWQSERRLLAQDWAMGLDSGGHAWEGQHAPDEAVQALLARVDQVGGRAGEGGGGGIRGGGHQLRLCAHLRHLRSASGQHVWLEG